MEKPRTQIVRTLQLELFEIEVQLRDVAAKRKEIKARLANLGAGTKVCTRCNEEMDIDQFYVDKQKSDKRSSWCQECVRIKQADVYYRRKRAA